MVHYLPLCLNLMPLTLEQPILPITNWSEDDRPRRKKLMLKGKSALKRWLIATLIGSVVECIR
jgi:hypothetical protein